MIRPNIKEFHKSIFDPIFQRKGSRNSFLNHSYFDDAWSKKTKVKVVESDHLLKLELTLPGLEKSDIQVSVDKDILKIKAAVQQKRPHTSKYILEEYNTDYMERTFKLLDEIGKEQLSANYENDVLTLTFIDVPASEEVVTKTVAVQ